ncbi:hypothetical protein IGI37_000800 [Enterococcus sp. AZ194]|uniref:SpaA isopeptide-forming pilin-related protein n=1 Tax=Enterococcus sp. AZ194 TaxID=2774629 RepID=UPI003F227581
MQNKKIEKIIYSLMTLLIFTQSFLPILAIAQTKNPATMTVKSAKVSAVDAQTAHLTLEGTVVPGEDELEKTLSFAEATHFLPKESQSLGIRGATYTTTSDQLRIDLKQKSNGEFSIQVAIDRKTLGKSLTLLLDGQKIPVVLPDSIKRAVLDNPTNEAEETTSVTNQSQTKKEGINDSEVDSEAIVSSEGSDLNQSSASISSDSEETNTTSSTAAQAIAESTGSTDLKVPTETEDSSEQTETTTTKEKQNPTNKAGRLAESGMDIRTYFPNGQGTILDKAEVTFYDNEGKQLEGTVPVDAQVRIHYEWSIPEVVRKQIQAGDHFTFQLPEGVVPVKSQTGELTNAAGEAYASYTIDKTGQVVIVFNERVSKEIDIEGTFDFSTEFNRVQIDGPGDYQITFPTEDKIPPVEVVIKPNTKTSIAKKGQFDRTPNPTEVAWQVDFNQAMNVLDNPVISEKWPVGLIYQSVKVYKLVMNFDGTVKQVGEEVPDSQYTVDSNGNAHFKGEVTDAYRIDYVTRIEERAIPKQGGKVTFTNTATLTDKGRPDGLDAKASVTNTFGKMVEKKKTGYSSTKQEFSWEIHYNYGEKVVPKEQAIIQDEMSPNMSLSEDPIIYPIVFGEKGEEIKAATPLVAGTDYELVKNPSGNGFVIKFLHEVNHAYKVTYKTKVNGIITEPTDIENNVSVGTGETSTGKGTANQQNVNKSLIKDRIDYQNKTVDWTIQVNKNHYEMFDLTLTDTFSPVPGLELKKTVDLTAYQMTVKSSTGKVLKQGVDYQVEPTVNQEGQQTGYVLKFIGAYNPTNTDFTVTYTTNFDIELIDPNNSALDHFTNDIRADWISETGESRHSEDKDTFKPNPSYSLNAQKSGAYNAQKKTIKWTTAVNLSGNLLKDAVFIDPILNNQSYVADSLQVYEATTNPDGTVTKLDEEPDNQQMPSIIQPSASNNQTVEVHFPNESQHTYLLEFETSLEGKVIEIESHYDNQATYENDGQKRDVIGEVSVKNGGAHIQKAGEQDKESPDYVNWHLTINPTQSVLKNVTVVDKPSANQIVDEASIKLYETMVAVDGTISVNKEKRLIRDTDYSLVLNTDNVTGEQTIEVSFLHEIRTAYMMNYRALINSSATGSQDKVTNEAVVTGAGEKTVSDTSGKEVTVSIDHSGGSASGKKGKITFQKIAGDKISFLTGAYFQLWDTTKSQVLREGQVDANGKITFGNLQLGDYLLVETVAPTGYTIPDELVHGRRVSITAETSSSTAQPVAIINTPNRVILTKTGEQGERLANALFRLEKQEGLLWFPVGLFMTDAQGVLVIDSLALGDYRLIETQAPKGYLLNTTPLEFTVARNQKNQIPTVELEMVDYKGTSKIMKVSEEGKGLAGAQFKVIDKKGKTIQAGLKSNSQGVISVTGLAPGTYAFVETQAPTGYILNTRSYSFTIDEKAAGKPAIVTGGQAINYQGAAELVKEDQDKKPLSDAHFKVIDKTGQTIRENLVSDMNGKVNVRGLAPGEYQFVETKAPIGYILNTKATAFSIPKVANGKPTVVFAGTLTNYLGEVILQKVNTANEPLEGAEFTLYDKEMNEVDKTTSGKDGQVRFERMAPGTYYLIETKAPKLADGTDYVMNPYPVEVVIPNKTDNQPVRIDKGQFQNFKGRAEIQKTGENGSVAGAEFALMTIENGQEKFEKTVIVPESGHLPIEDLGAGYYKLVETKAAPGYIINSQPIYFVVDSDVQEAVDHFEFQNYQSELVGQKVDGDQLTETGLSGAEFQIYEQTEEGKEGAGPISFTDKTGQPSETVVSDEQGQIYAAGLPVGRYLLVETKAPEGYVRDLTERGFEITEQSGKPDILDLGTIENYRGKLDITKVNEKQEPLAGGTFVLSNTKDASEPITVIDREGNATTELQAVEGHILAQGIKPGTYYLVETKAPEGYIINTEPIEVVIPNEANGQEALRVTGELVNYKGSVIMTKVDEADQALSGAEFAIVDSQGKIVQEKIVSDANGVVRAENLSPGSYQLVEVKAPETYILNTKGINFAIEATHMGKPDVVNISEHFINYRGVASLTKVDTKEKPLAGAEFKVVDQNAEVVAANLISDVGGKVMVDGLAPGTYQFVEVKAPKGYALNNKPVSFTIEAKAENEPAVQDAGLFVNKELPVPTEKPNKPEKPDKPTPEKPEKPEDLGKPKNGGTGKRLPGKKSGISRFLPQTNEQTNGTLIIYGGLMILVVAGLTIWRRKKRDKEIF